MPIYIADAILVKPRGEKIRELKEELGESWKEIGRAIKVGRTTLLNSFGKTSKPKRVSKDILKKLANLWGAEIEELYYAGSEITRDRLMEIMRQKASDKAAEKRKVLEELKQNSLNDTPETKAYMEVLHTLSGTKKVELGEAEEASEKIMELGVQLTTEQGVVNSYLKNASGAGKKYRELVGVFSKNALSHAEAMKVLRTIHVDAMLWRKHRPTIREMGSLLKDAER